MNWHVCLYKIIVKTVTNYLFSIIVCLNRNNILEFYHFYNGNNDLNDTISLNSKLPSEAFLWITFSYVDVDKMCCAQCVRQHHPQYSNDTVYQVNKHNQFCRRICQCFFVPMISVRDPDNSFLNFFLLFKEKLICFLCL